MATFITISEGDDAVDAHQLLVIDDPGVAREVARVIARRLGLSEATVRALRALPAGSDEGIKR
jgi:hypothetical protein